MTQAFNLSQLANNLNTSGQLDATDGLTGSVPVANGGTGQSSLTANAVLLGNGTSGVQAVAPSTSGNVLVSNGTTWVSQAPAGGGVTSLNGQTGAITNTSINAIGAYSTGIAGGSPNQVFAQGSTIAGSSLQNANSNPFSGYNTRNGGNYSLGLTGTWRLTTKMANGGGDKQGYYGVNCGLWVRVS